MTLIVIRTFFLIITLFCGMKLLSFDDYDFRRSMTYTVVGTTAIFGYILLY